MNQKINLSIEGVVFPSSVVLIIHSRSAHRRTHALAKVLNQE
jgi:hypothetical protein